MLEVLFFIGVFAILVIICLYGRKFLPRDKAMIAQGMDRDDKVIGNIGASYVSSDDEK